MAEGGVELGSVIRSKDVIGHSRDDIHGTAELMEMHLKLSRLSNGSDGSSLSRISDSNPKLGFDINDETSTADTTSKHTSGIEVDLLFTDSELNHSVYENSNQRPYMEDRHVIGVVKGIGHFGVFDGHGGTFAAEYLKEYFHSTLLASELYPNEMIQALKNTCDHVEKGIMELSVKQKAYAGSTGIYVVVTESDIICCNVGDSRAVLCRSRKAVALSDDHSPLRLDEVKRIKDAGGYVDAKGVNGYISLTRAFGDMDLKAHKHITFPKGNFTADLLVAEPEFVTMTRDAEDEFIIVACDGLWCRIGSDAAVKIASASLRKTGGDPQQCARKLAKAAQMAGSTDNLTVIVVILNRARCVGDSTVHGGGFFKKINFAVLAPTSQGSSPSPSVSAQLVDSGELDDSPLSKGNLLWSKSARGEPTSTRNRSLFRQPRSVHGGKAALAMLNADSPDSSTQKLTPSTASPTASDFSSKSSVRKIWNRPKSNPSASNSDTLSSSTDISGSTTLLSDDTSAESSSQTMVNSSPLAQPSLVSGNSSKQSEKPKSVVIQNADSVQFDDRQKSTDLHANGNQRGANASNSSSMNVAHNVGRKGSKSVHGGTAAYALLQDDPSTNGKVKSLNPETRAKDESSEGSSKARGLFVKLAASKSQKN